MRECRLNIVEPWDIGTENPIGASIVDKVGDQYLLKLTEPRVMKGQSVRFLIAEPRAKGDKIDFVSVKARGLYPVNMVYSSNITIENFKVTSLNDFRSNFAIGDILIE